MFICHYIYDKYCVSCTESCSVIKEIFVATVATISNPENRWYIIRFTMTTNELLVSMRRHTQVRHLKQLRHLLLSYTWPQSPISLSGTKYCPQRKNKIPYSLFPPLERKWRSGQMNRLKVEFIALSCLVLLYFLFALLSWLPATQHLVSLQVFFTLCNHERLFVCTNSSSFLLVGSIKPHQPAATAESLSILNRKFLSDPQPKCSCNKHTRVHTQTHKPHAH